MLSSQRPLLAASSLDRQGLQTDYQLQCGDKIRKPTTTPSPAFSTSTYMQHSSTPFFFVPALTDPNALSTSEGTTSVLVLPSASSPPKIDSPRTAFPTILHNGKDRFNTFLLSYSVCVQTPFLTNNISFSPSSSCITDSNAPSETNGRKNGSVSEAVFADLAMTSLYADKRAFQFYVAFSLSVGSKA